MAFLKIFAPAIIVGIFLEGVQNFLLEKGNKPEKGVDVEMGTGGCHFLITLKFISITFTVCVVKVRFPLLLF